MVPSSTQSAKAKSDIATRASIGHSDPHRPRPNHVTSAMTSHVNCRSVACSIYLRKATTTTTTVTTNKVVSKT